MITPNKQSIANTCKINPYSVNTLTPGRALQLTKVLTPFPGIPAGPPEKVSRSVNAGAISVVIKNIVILAVLMVFATYANGQQIITKHIKVGYDKTTFIVFSGELDFYDVGSEDLLFQITQKPNIVKVKAAVEQFPETNITIITKEGEYYSLIVSYDADPDTLNYIFTDGQPILLSNEAKEEKKEEEMTNKALADAEYVLRESQDITFPNTHSTYRYKTGMAISGIYFYNNQVYFNINITNKSPIDYQIEAIMFFVQQKRKRRQASTAQDINLQPIVTKGMVEQVRAGAEARNILVVLNQFTITENQKLTVSLLEKDGVRNLEIDITSKDLLRGRRIQ